MPGDELFKRYLEIGASVLGMSRERAESIVRDLVASGEVAKGQAAKAADWLVERGRSGTDELVELVRREIRQQVTALGLASKDDLARLQAEVDELRAAATAGPPPAAAPADPGPAPAKAAATKKRPAAAKKPAASKAGTAAPSAPAGITRSGSVRKRPGTSSSPAGGADPTKG